MSYLKTYCIGCGKELPKINHHHSNEKRMRCRNCSRLHTKQAAREYQKRPEVIEIKRKQYHKRYLRKKMEMMNHV